MDLTFFLSFKYFENDQSFTCVLVIMFLQVSHCLFCKWNPLFSAERHRLKHLRKVVPNLFDFKAVTSLYLTGGN